jgi:hypothetical protein
MNETLILLGLYILIKDYLSYRDYKLREKLKFTKYNKKDILGNMH